MWRTGIPNVSKTRASAALKYFEFPHPVPSLEHFRTECNPTYLKDNESLLEDRVEWADVKSFPPQPAHIALWRAEAVSHQNQG